MSTIWIKNPFAIWTGTENDADSGIVIQGNTITELVQAGKEPSAPVDSIFDAREYILIPGLINCHHHFYQTLTRALPQALNKSLFCWLQQLYPVWSFLSEEDIRVSTQLAIAELLLSGCTTTVDHHYLFNEHLDQAIDIQAETAENAGIRVCLCRGAMSLGQSAGGLPPDSIVQKEDHILYEYERLIKKFHHPDNDSMLQLALAPCSPFSVSKELMQESAKLARKHNILLHTHLAETEDETTYCLKNFGKRPVEYLESLGWMDRDVWLAHGIHFNGDEISLLGKNRIGISHCPTSNMILGSGHCKIIELEQAGCPVGLGVDGSASNDCSNMMNELRQALLLHRFHYGPEQVGHQKILRLGTSGGANVLHRKDIGTLDIGMKADIALFSSNDIQLSGSHDPLAALLLSGAPRVSHLMVDGKWKVRSGKLVDLDAKKLCISHRNCARNLINRSQESRFSYPGKGQ